MPSPFLTPGTAAQEHHLASFHLRRDLSLPVILSTTATSALDEGYAEGVVTNTRFGSFPHSTIINAPWGSQIRASLVDTGSRGRKESRRNLKRKADAITDGHDETTAKEAVVASSGFIHVLQPTPENWTTSLPHRTQVVYTPDYSYILHRIRARPGSVLIEAGSGSGSFTHAAARAVFNGYPEDELNGDSDQKRSQSYGRVFTFEFHAERHTKIAQEMAEHGLNSVVTATHRDVYNDGFLLPSSSSNSPSDAQNDLKTSPLATAIFLDLPAPWLALPHLTRTSPSPLSPIHPVHVATFSPCIEQATKTISTLRRLNYIDIEMVEIQHRRIDIRREYTGLAYDGMRGVNSVAATVEEGLERLRAIEGRSRDFHEKAKRNGGEESGTVKQTRLSNKQQEAAKVLYKDGRLVHRSEPELKTHTSYLVFAVLPQEWREEDEERARARWARQVGKGTVDGKAVGGPKSHRQLKREAKVKAMGKGQSRGAHDNGEAQAEVEQELEGSEEVQAGEEMEVAPSS